MLISTVLIEKISSRDENKDMHLTSKAKEELKNWIRFRNFINSYTLLKDKKFEEIAIYEKYIPFAMVLNVNKKYTNEMIKILGKEEINILIEDMKKYKKINNTFVEYYYEK